MVQGKKYVYTCRQTHIHTHLKFVKKKSKKILSICIIKWIMNLMISVICSIIYQLIVVKFYFIYSTKQKNSSI